MVATGDFINAAQWNALASTIGDTGWIAPALGTGWSVYNSETIKYRRLNGLVHLQGRGTSTGTSAVAFILPTGFLPSLIIVATAPNSGGVHTIYSINPSGGNVGQNAAAAVTGFSFGSMKPFVADA